MMINTTTMSSTISSSTDNLPDFVHIFSVENHDYWKPKLLESIERMKDINNIQLNDEGYYLDYHLKTNRTYKNLMNNILFSYINELEEIYGSSFYRMTAYWFHQYIQGSDFAWHHHHGHFAIIYYVELPEVRESTEFLNYGQFNVKEGDIIFFPTFLVHRSPKIISNKRKTIISTNLDIQVNRNLIEKYGKEHFRH